MEEKASSSKGIYTLLGLLFVVLIGGTTAWFYLTGDPKTDNVTENNSQSAQESEISAAETDLDQSLKELDEEIEVITADEASDDDTINI